MTYDPRTNPPPADDTRVVERETYVERDTGYVPPAAQPAGSQVNVNTGGAAAAPAYVATTPGPLYYARRVVSLLFAVLAVLIGLRILLLLFVANPGNAIVDFIYSVTEPFVAPFHLPGSEGSHGSDRTRRLAGMDWPRAILPHNDWL